MKIYVDCDGVLADWVGQVHSWAEKPRKDWKSWDDFKSFGITQAELDDMMSFVSFWDNMDRLPGAAKLWSELCKLGDKVYVCTRPFPAPNCLYGRAVWLAKMGISIQQTIFMHDKYQLANSKSILIDDNIENCELFTARGGHTVLYPQSYNGTIEVKDKTEFVLDAVRKIIGENNG